MTRVLLPEEAVQIARRQCAQHSIYTGMAAGTIDSFATLEGKAHYCAKVAEHAQSRILALNTMETVAVHNEEEEHLVGIRRERAVWQALIPYLVHPLHLLRTRIDVTNTDQESYRDLIRYLVDCGFTVHTFLGRFHSSKKIEEIDVLWDWDCHEPIDVCFWKAGTPMGIPRGEIDNHPGGWDRLVADGVYMG